MSWLQLLSYLNTASVDGDHPRAIGFALGPGTSRGSERYAWHPWNAAVWFLAGLL